MQRQIFRAAALERLSSPEQLDQLMRVTTPRGWLSLAALAIPLVVALLWGIFGRVPVQVSGQGMFVRGSGVQAVESTMAGQVQSVEVAAGDVVEQGQELATVVPSGSATSPSAEQKPVPVLSPYRGRILEVMTNRGGVVGPSTTVATVEAIDDPLQVVLYLPSAEGKKVRAGMAVQIEPETASKEEFGVLRGTIRSVADFPSTSAGIKRVLQNDQLVQLFLGAGPPIEVRVELVPSTFSPSGYEWSSAGPPFEIDSGTLARATITLSERRPITFVLPILND